MSSKFVIAAAALAVIASSADAAGTFGRLRSALDLSKRATKVPYKQNFSSRLNKVHDEEEAGYWELNGGASNNPNGGVNWNIGGKIGGTFDEDTQKLHHDLRKATETLHQLEEFGLLDEDVELDVPQKLKLGKLVNNALHVVNVAGSAGLLEEFDLIGFYECEEFLMRCARGHNLLFEDEEEASKFKLNLGKVVKGINTGLDLLGKAKGVGLFDEEEGGFQVMHPRSTEFDLRRSLRQRSFDEEEANWGIRPIPIVPDFIRPIHFEEDEAKWDPEFIRPIRLFDEEEAGWDIRPIPIVPDFIRPIRSFEENDQVPSPAKKYPLRRHLTPEQFHRLISTGTVYKKDE